MNGRGEGLWFGRGRKAIPVGSGLDGLQQWCQVGRMEACLVAMPQGEKERGGQHGLCLRMVAAIHTGAGTDQRRGPGRGEELPVFLWRKQLC